MNQPDLSTKAGRKAYKHEMRMIAVRPRRIGMALLAIGLLLLLLPIAVGVHSVGGWSPRFLGLVLVALALPFLIAATWMRGRYHRQRLGVAPTKNGM